MPNAGQTKNLYVKSFFTASVEEAMQQAHEELGPDALLLNTREAPPEARHLGQYEVVFGHCADHAAVSDAARPSEDLRRRVEEIYSLLSRITPSAGWQQPGTSLVEHVLLKAGLEPDIASGIADSVKLRVAKRSILPISGPRQGAEVGCADLVADVASEIESRFDVNADLGRIMALVGPAGAGKTTTIVKLAVAQGLALGKPVRLISMDTHRIGGAEQLRTYASILGVGFQAVDNTAALAHAIDAFPGEGCMFIDTPGYSAPMLRDFGGDLAAFLSNRQDLDTHLVLTASMRLSDLRTIADLYSVFRPVKLLFTRMDETNSYASAFCEAVRLGKPLSFFGNGQSIPEDVEPATKTKITASLVRQLPQALEAVA